MSEKSKIAWTDSTLNFWEGCTKVSAGCANCYAEARDKRFTGGLHWGKGAPRRKSKSAVKDALAFNRKPLICDKCAEVYLIGTEGCCCDGSINKLHRRRIFSLSLGDWLDEVPIEWLAEMLDTIRQCPNVDWILCSKRPENFFPRMKAALDFVAEQCSPTDSEQVEWLGAWMDGQPPLNIILLTSVENQAAADLRIPQLLQIPARVHGLSCEPLLGSVELFNENTPDEKDPTWNGSDCKRPHIGWIIVGGESGSNARPCNVEWIRSLVEQGKAAGVPVFVKQLGSNQNRNLPVECPQCHCISNQEPGDSCIRGCDAKMAEQQFKDPKGGDINEFPEDLKVREFYK